MENSQLSLKQQTYVFFIDIDQKEKSKFVKAIIKVITRPLTIFPLSVPESTCTIITPLGTVCIEEYCKVLQSKVYRYVVLYTRVPRVRYIGMQCIVYKGAWWGGGIRRLGEARISSLCYSKYHPSGLTRHTHVDRDLG